MMATDDRTQYDSDTYTREERDDFQTKLDAVDEAKDVFLLEVAAAARKYAQAIHAAEPRFVARFSNSTKQIERGAEGVEGFVDDARAINSDVASDFLDHEEIERVRNISERGVDG